MSPRPHKCSEDVGTRLGAFYVYERAGELVADLYLSDLRSEKNWILVFSGKRLPCSPFLIDGRILLYSRDQAPNGNVSEITEDGVERRVLAPELEASIQQIAFTEHHLFTSYCIDCTTVIRRWPPTGAQSELGETLCELGSGATIEFLPNLGHDLSSFFYTRETFTEPPVIREYPGESKALPRIAQTICTGRPNRFRVDEVYFSSKDGTRIPMSLVAARDRSMKSARPVIMTSYGGFGVSMTPAFSVLVAIMAGLGAIFALPNTRGGSEFGHEWHDAARRRNRQTSFTDFICAASLQHRTLITRWTTWRLHVPMESHPLEISEPRSSVQLAPTRVRRALR
jgi:prolyl oligopeptidase